eukprot:TRINITY_DN5775_c0_g1_i1.p1 TRINITY_DN5775_c0_g1~~TRINITY_DN5775_c0_g1_i1.p1  ORF type:complete len:1612 (+),score=393.89 TRINITY_DN5775_c0_g1_i1:59-4837(+)
MVFTNAVAICPSGHPLKLSEYLGGGYSMGWQCDRCMKRGGGVRWLCGTCSHDLCIECASGRYGSPARRPPIPPLPATAGVPASPSPSVPDAGLSGLRGRPVDEVWEPGMGPGPRPRPVDAPSSPPPISPPAVDTATALLQREGSRHRSPVAARLSLSPARYPVSPSVVASRRSPLSGSPRHRPVDYVVSQARRITDLEAEITSLRRQQHRDREELRQRTEENAALRHLVLDKESAATKLAAQLHSVLSEYEEAKAAWKERELEWQRVLDSSRAAIADYANRSSELEGMILDSERKRSKAEHELRTAVAASKASQENESKQQDEARQASALCGSLAEEVASLRQALASGDEESARLRAALAGPRPEAQAAPQPTGLQNIPQLQQMISQAVTETFASLQASSGSAAPALVDQSIASSWTGAAATERPSLADLSARAAGSPPPDRSARSAAAEAGLPSASASRLTQPGASARTATGRHLPETEMAASGAHTSPPDSPRSATARQTMPADSIAATYLSVVTAADASGRSARAAAAEAALPAGSVRQAAVSTRGAAAGVSLPADSVSSRVVLLGLPDGHVQRPEQSTRGTAAAVGLPDSTSQRPPEQSTRGAASDAALPDDSTRPPVEQQQVSLSVRAPTAERLRADDTHADFGGQVASQFKELPSNCPSAEGTFSGIVPGVTSTRSAASKHSRQSPPPLDVPVTPPLSVKSNRSPRPPISPAASAAFPALFRVLTAGDDDDEFLNISTSHANMQLQLPPITYRPRVGEWVKVESDAAAARQKQTDWTDAMDAILGQVGMVTKQFADDVVCVRARGDWSVSVRNLRPAPEEPPAPAVKAYGPAWRPSKGSLVWITDDLPAARLCQPDWSDAMDAAAGQIGVVTKVFTDDLICVRIGMAEWGFCCANLSPAPAELTGMQPAAAPDTLPVAAPEAMPDPLPTLPAAPPRVPPSWKPRKGAQVRVIQDAQQARSAQSDWTEAMDVTCGQTGVVTSVFDEQKVCARVGMREWIFHVDNLVEAAAEEDDLPARPVPAWAPKKGAMVRVTDDVAAARRAQADWTENMDVVAGRVGMVTTVLDEEKVCARVDMREWIFNVANLSPARIDEPPASPPPSPPPERWRPKKGAMVRVTSDLAAARANQKDWVQAMDVTAGQAGVVTNVLSHDTVCARIGMLEWIFSVSNLSRAVDVGGEASPPPPPLPPESPPPVLWSPRKGAAVQVTDDLRAARAIQTDWTDAMDVTQGQLGVVTVICDEEKVCARVGMREWVFHVGNLMPAADPLPQSTPPSPPRAPTVVWRPKKGTPVRITDDVAVARSHQTDWTDAMDITAGQTGVVTAVFDEEKVTARVGMMEWIFHVENLSPADDAGRGRGAATPAQLPAAPRKGDLVRVTSDLAAARAAQPDWAVAMDATAGESGVVTKLLDDATVVVRVGAIEWIYSVANLRPPADHRRSSPCLRLLLKASGAPGRGLGGLLLAATDTRKIAAFASVEAACAEQEAAWQRKSSITAALGYTNASSIVCKVQASGRSSTYTGCIGARDYFDLVFTQFEHGGSVPARVMNRQGPSTVTARWSYPAKGFASVTEELTFDPSTFLIRGHVITM